jgi:hypothetical protein
MVMKKASGGDSPLQQGAGKRFWTLLIASTMVAAYSMFSGKEFGPLGFSRRGDYIGGRAMSGGGPGGHTPWWHGLALARATSRCGWPLVRLLLSFRLRLCVR